MWGSLSIIYSIHCIQFFMQKCLKKDSSTQIEYDHMRRDQLYFVAFWLADTLTHDESPKLKHFLLWTIAVKSEDTAYRNSQLRTHIVYYIFRTYTTLATLYNNVEWMNRTIDPHRHANCTIPFISSLYHFPIDNHTHTKS